MNMSRIRQRYSVPAKRGARVEYSGHGSPITGTITRSIQDNLWVRLDGSKRSVILHPEWGLRYLSSPAASS
ncbi:conserved hypothetical protein [Hyphomicrobiales bacterium]|jgi:hypothetical protein|nr:conserved hypothetical protein [Hyphomicrobiales bacterium]CAH1702815.1 conserved hypothetical protein [Hyphomicrobiales bacterium]CAI0347004.1 conserved hypothetical protein [Hyphomicrobiales bacterium]